MGRCHLFLHTFTISLLCLSVQIISCLADTCQDAEQEAIRKFYRGEISEPYSCVDKHGISHGEKCNKKCNAIMTYVGIYGCDPAFLDLQCPLRKQRKRRSSHSLESECNTQTTFCSSEYEYRTIDGSCNNIRNPFWGKSHRAQRRDLPNAYDDAKGSPRTIGCSGKLPSPRHISNIIHRADDNMVFDERLSYMMMQFGQFLAHDVVLTELMK
ncbi:myeloperoxidase-like, partial [Ruditapes philippinarum]|uniref:myeloperoxidase-like n=1 Tax=Ruditapes philippinarum TaxID=129788 RepID=UPI00295A8696